MLISHTGLDTQLVQNANMARMMRPRLINKEQAKTVADAGGVIGVWAHLADSALEYAQNIRVLVEVADLDHVCLGTDTKPTPSYRRAGGNGRQPSRPGRQPGGPGGGQNRPRAGEPTNQVWPDQQAGFYYAVVEAMLKTGFTPEEIGKVGGGNFCRVFGAATASHR